MSKLVVRGGWLALGCIATVLLAGCVGGASSASRAPDLRGDVVPVSGCENGRTDQTDLQVGRLPARCGSGTPAPQPLSQPVKLRVSVAFRGEYAAPVLLAQSLGEFEKENLTVEFVTLPTSDAIPQLSQGQLDASVGGYDLSLFNASRIGLNVRAVLGNFYPPSAGDYSVPQTGLWCRRSAFTTPASPDPAETQRLRWGSGVGKASSGIYYAIAELKKRVPDFNGDALPIVNIPGSEMTTALKNGAIDCATLIDPMWIDFATPEYVLMATQLPGEPLGSVLFGKSLLRDTPAVGDAFARAVIRTINTYLAGDYHQNPEVMALIAVAINQPVKLLERTSSLTMDWEIRQDTTTRMQQEFIDLDVITAFEEPVSEEHLVDRSFYEHATGRTG
jgi:NitT/TauT family transport system substrate-binding protein